MQILTGILMFFLIAGALVCIVALVFVVIRPSAAKVSADNLPALSPIPLLDEREAKLMADLTEVSQRTGTLLFAKTPLSAIVEAEKDTIKQEWQEKLCVWQVDFLLCDPLTLKPVLAILPVEQGGKREQRHKVCTSALASVDIPYILLGNYNLAGLEKAVREKRTLAGGKSPAAAGKQQ